MAAPTPSSRPAPSGIKLIDGYSSMVTIALASTIGLWAKSVTGPGVDGGDPIEQTTMHNEDWRTFANRALLTLTELTFTCAFDPAAIATLVANVNRPTTITRHYSDGSTLAFYGYIVRAEDGDHTEGEQPEMTVTIQPTNFDHVNKVEAAPVLTSVAGT
jgi:hypothetical protein